MNIFLRFSLYGSKLNTQNNHNMRSIPFNNDQLRNNSRQSVKLYEAACESVNNQGRITVW